MLGSDTFHQVLAEVIDHVISGLSELSKHLLVSFAGFCVSLCVDLWFSMHDIFAVASSQVLCELF